LQYPLSAICQQLEIVFSAYACCFQVVLDDEGFNRIISGDNHGPFDAGFKVGSVTSMLPDKLWSKPKKNGGHKPPVFFGRHEEI
jgi:hypothetical protein